MAESFLFYDLETFGQDPRRTRIAQFAAVRTDAQLQVIDEPVSLSPKAEPIRFSKFTSLSEPEPPVDWLLVEARLTATAAVAVA